VWCSSSHALRPGVYHARAGGPLRFDGVAVPERGMSEVIHRGLVGANPPGDQDRGFDVRATGSAAVECAFVAAGVLRCAHLCALYPWDVAGGLALLRAAGCRTLVEEDGRWAEFERFVGPLDQWHRPLIIGDEAGTRMLAG